MKHSKVRDSPLPPAIPDVSISPIEVARIFELKNQRVTVFDDRDRELLKGVRGHFIKGNLEGQVAIDGW